MNFRALCLNTIGLSSLLSGIGTAFFSSCAWAENTVSKSSDNALPPSQKSHLRNENIDESTPAIAKQEDLVVTASRRNRMYVSSGGDLGALGNKKGLDVPFNIRSYNSSLILNQQAQTLGEVLLNDPTVRTTTGYGNYAQLFQIRGFTLYGDDVAIDGLYGVTPRQLVSPQLYDSVQVLNGASAFLNGADPGG